MEPNPYMRHFCSGVVVVCYGLVLFNCSEKKVATEETTFTKQDSVTDSYLAYQDSMLQAWNVMINDDNQKIKSMHNLLHELQVSNPNQKAEFAVIQERLEQLLVMRYTQKSMENPDVVEEYDFASNSLLSELISTAEAQSEFAYNTTLQALVEEIQMADQRTINYRQDYDAIVNNYNNFIDRNKNFLSDINTNTLPEKKPMFQMVSEDE
jgi:septal ring factor EnvC (AmiA/AmiB activator)